MAKCDGDEVETEKIIQDVYASLFMKMLDIPHEAQAAMVEMSYAYYKNLEIKLEGLTDIKISTKDLLSLKEKVSIIEPLLDGRSIKLKSTDDRNKIDIDADIQ